MKKPLYFPEGTEKGDVLFYTRDRMQKNREAL
jgi:hypothetical protein